MAQNSWKLLITHVHIEASTGPAEAKVTEVMGYGVRPMFWLTPVLLGLKIDSVLVSE